MERRTHFCDWDAFSAEIDLRVAGMTNEERTSHQQCVKAINEAYKSSIRTTSLKPEPYWWNDTIQEKWRQCTCTRRILTSLKPEPYWWNDTIQEKWRQCTCTRRILTRAATN
ncbi:hypothetical protein QE152_g984 [Popillia japonica]|uniref:Uncharacterized protein n=1 Tax=Popillia japonica TaxID=7064 RepID=A0AAW1N9I9_POPJA